MNIPLTGAELARSLAIVAVFPKISQLNFLAGPNSPVSPMKI